MRKHLEVDIPKDAEAEVENVKQLRASVFTRTRIAALSFLLVLALGAVGATHAFVQFTANQSPNRDTVARISVRIGEKASLDAATVYDEGGEYALGLNNKVVFVEAGDAPTELKGTVTVSIIPEVESKTFANNAGETVSDGYQAFAQEWSALKQETIDGVEWDYIETSIVKVYLAQGWSNNWTFQKNNGIFKYNKALEPGEKTDNLISGVAMQDTVNKDTYKSVKLSVLARTVQASEE